jgi:hypothetical protein
MDAIGASAFQLVSETKKRALEHFAAIATERG